MFIMDLINLLGSCVVLTATIILWIEVKHGQHTQQRDSEFVDNRLAIFRTQLELLKLYCQDIRLHLVASTNSPLQPESNIHTGKNQNGDRVITLLRCAEADLKGEIDNFDPEGCHSARQTLKEIADFFHDQSQEE